MPRSPRRRVSQDLRLNRKQAIALRELVRYCYDTELDHFLACEADERQHHVFTSIRCLALACGHIDADEDARLTALEAEADTPPW